MSADNPFAAENYSAQRNVPNYRALNKENSLSRQGINIQQSPALSKSGLDMITGEKDTSKGISNSMRIEENNKIGPTIIIKKEESKENIETISPFKSFMKTKGEREIPLDEVKPFRNIIAKDVGNESIYSNKWANQTDYDESESVESSKRGTFLVNKDSPKKRLGWPAKKKRTIIDAGKKSISKNMNDGDLNQTTTSFMTPSLYEVPTDTPLGLDLEKFLITETNFGDANDQNHQEKVMQSIIKDNKTMLSILNKRTLTVRTLMNWWNKGNIDSTINALTSKRDTSVVMDFFNYAFVKGDHSNFDQITMENAAALLAHLFSLINSKYETYLIVGIKALKVIFEHVSIIISNECNIMREGGEVSMEVKQQQNLQKALMILGQLEKLK